MMRNKLFGAILYMLMAALWLWSSLALYFYGFNTPAKELLAIAFAILVPTVLFLVKRPYGVYVVFVLYLGVIGLWGQKQASLDKDWQISVARLPHVEREGSTLTVYDIRNFTYQTETKFTPHYYNKRFDLEQLNAVDYILSYWDGNLAVAHTMLSFGFMNGDHLVVSLETRLAKNQLQNGLNGLFKQYEVIYILADEADILRLRTNYRKEQVFVYPLNLTAAVRKAILTRIVERVNQLYRQPEFYNTLTHNCFTGLQSDLRSISQSGKRVLFDYRWFLNGYSDAMIYENGKMLTDLSFADAKQFFHINPYAETSTTDNFSQVIRP
jgi:hypothetical protein